MREIGGPEVALGGVDALLRVPVVVEQVAGGVRKGQTDSQQYEVWKQSGRQAHGGDREQGPDYHRVDRHDEDDRPSGDEPAAEGVEVLDGLGLRIVGPIQNRVPGPEDAHERTAWSWANFVFKR